MKFVLIYQFVQQNAPESAVQQNGSMLVSGVNVLIFSCKHCKYKHLRCPKHPCRVSLVKNNSIQSLGHHYNPADRMYNKLTQLFKMNYTLHLSNQTGTKLLQTQSCLDAKYNITNHKELFMYTYASYKPLLCAMVFVTYVSWLLRQGNVWFGRGMNQIIRI